MSRPGIPLTLTAAALLAGCGALLPRAEPDELGALTPEEREPLASREAEVTRVRVALGLAARDREMAAARLAASARKPRITESRLAWIDAERELARQQNLDERLGELEACRIAEAGLADVVKSEIAAMDAHLAAAKGREDELDRQLSLAEAELERARVAAAFGRRGISYAERDEAVGKWDLEVSKRRGAAEAALVERRQREVRAADAEKVWLGLSWAWRGRHTAPCTVDWALPAPDRKAPTPPDAGERALGTTPATPAAPKRAAEPPAPAEPLQAPTKPLETPRTSRAIETPTEGDVEVFPLQ